MTIKVHLIDSSIISINDKCVINEDKFEESGFESFYEYVVHSYLFGYEKNINIEFQNKKLIIPKTSILYIECPDITYNGFVRTQN